MSMMSTTPLGFKEEEGMERLKKRDSPPRWSELPNHIAEMIADCLSFPDILRFASVSVTWRWIAADTAKRRRLRSYQSPPLVMFDYNLEKGMYGFFNFQESRTYWINIPEAPAVRCLGCSEGWLILQDPSLSLIFLLNPFTRHQIFLPTVRKSVCKNSVKVILFSNPIDHITGEKNKKCVVVVLDKFMRLFSCKLGDKSWTSSMTLDSYMGTHYLGGFVFYRSQLYSLSIMGELWVCDLTVENSICSPRKCNVAFPVSVYPRGSFLCYLLESQGFLLLVIRYFQTKEPRGTFNFMIFKLVKSNDSDDPDGGSYVWEKQTSLDYDQALFVGRFCSKSVSLTSRDCVGLHRSTIYFTDDVLLSFDKRKYPELGIYYVVDGRIERCLPFDINPFDNSSIWITPSI